MTVCETERQVLREVEADDAPFILALLNDPDFIRFIADRNVRTLDDARAYIANRLRSSYEQNGYGLWLVIRKDTQMPIGLCGLVKRDNLSHPDIGFAFLPESRGHGYAFEAAAATISHAREKLKIDWLLAFANQDNEHSNRLLKRLGLTTIGAVKLSHIENEVVLYALKASA